MERAPALPLLLRLKPKLIEDTVPLELQHWQHCQLLAGTQATVFDSSECGICAPANSRWSSRFVTYCSDNRERRWNRVARLGG